MKRPGLDIRYTYAVGRMRVLETRLLNESAFETILEEENMPSAIRALSEFNEYGRIAESLSDRARLEDVFLTETFNICSFINSMVYEKEMVEPFFKRLNILTQPITQSPEEIDRMAWKIFRNAWQENIFLAGYTKIAIDLENIKIFLRARNLGKTKKSMEVSFIEGGHIRRALLLDSFEKPLDQAFHRICANRYERALLAGFNRYNNTGRLDLLEKACDDFLIEYIKEAKHFPFGIEPLISYILAKENEIRNLKLILAGKANGFRPEEMRPFIRKSYV